MQRKDPLAAPLWPRISFAVWVGVAAVLAAVVGLASTRVGPFAGEPVAAVPAGPIALPAAHPSPIPRTSVSAATSTASDWRSVLGALDSARAAVFAAPESPSQLDAVDLRGSPSWLIDDRSRAQLAAAHVHARSLRMSLTSVRLLAASAGVAQLAVTDHLSAYDLVDSEGRVIEHRPARGDVGWRLTLVRLSSGWRVAIVVKD